MQFYYCLHALLDYIPRPSATPLKRGGLPHDTISYSYMTDRLYTIDRNRDSPLERGADIQ